MAGESESFTTAVSTEDAAKYGFDRTEMHSANLAGTVDYFERHIFLCYKSHDAWPSRVEASDSDPLPKLFASTLKARRDDIKIKTRLTICEAVHEVNLWDGDVLVFPEMIVYRGLTESDIDSFVEDVLVSGKPWQSGAQEELNGSFVFVCAHNERDRRCGVCGPPLIEKFKDEIQSQNSADPVFVTACSHIGGHKYAGNVIIFSAGPDGKIAGMGMSHLVMLLNCLINKFGRGKSLNGSGGGRWVSKRLKRLRSQSLLMELQTQTTSSKSLRRLVVEKRQSNWEAVAKVLMASLAAETRVLRRRRAQRNSRAGLGNGSSVISSLLLL